MQIANMYVPLYELMQFILQFSSRNYFHLSFFSTRKETGESEDIQFK